MEKESQGGVCSESGDDSDGKPKKKKMKITIKDTSLKKKPKTNSPAKTNLISESSDEEDDCKIKSSVGLSSDSDNSGSDSENITKKPSSIGKGKALIGKQRIVKKGVKNISSKKSTKPTTAISSDEESAPGNTKESLTNYLGLQGRSSLKSTVTKESNKMSVSEDEIECIDEIQRSRDGVTGKRGNDSSDNPSMNKATKLKAQMEIDRSESSHSTNSASKVNKELTNKFNTIADSDSDVEPIAVVNNPKSREPSNQARKSIRPCKVVPKKQSINKNKINAHESISDSSESESRTSDEESQSEKKNISDVELSSGTKDLSSDSSDNEVGKKKGGDKDEDDTIVILSEDVLEEIKHSTPKQNLGKPQNDSDSDEVCVLCEYRLYMIVFHILVLALS